MTVIPCSKTTGIACSGAGNNHYQAEGHHTMQNEWTGCPAPYTLTQSFYKLGEAFAKRNKHPMGRTAGRQTVHYWIRVHTDNLRLKGLGHFYRRMS